MGETQAEIGCGFQSFHAEVPFLFSGFDPAWNMGCVGTKRDPCSGRTKLNFFNNF